MGLIGEVGCMAWIRRKLDDVQGAQGSVVAGEAIWKPG